MDGGKVMRTIANVLATSACMFLIGAPSAFADQVSSEELAEMRAAVEQLKSQVEAQSEQIAHQGEVIREARIERAGQSESRFGASGITAFLQRLQIDGHVSGSYFYNFNAPDREFMSFGNTGLSGLVYPFHAASNSFQVDQVWFGIEHPVDTENRAGFRFDMVFGATACNFGNSPGGRCGADITSQYYVHQAYVQYLIPFTSNGIVMKAGKWSTLVGAEVAKTTDNFNVTRGALWGIMQPVDHVGVLFSTDFGESGFSSSLGVMNDDLNGFGADPDWNDSKSLVAQIGWAGETISVATTLLWGPSMAFNENNAGGLVDLVITWDPTDRISTWLNFDYAWVSGSPMPNAWGIAAAGRFAVTERMGISTRFEFLQDSSRLFQWVNVDAPFGQSPDGDLFTVTGTVDYALTNSLMLRGEVRYDQAWKRNSSDHEFFDRGFDVKKGQTTLGAEIVYAF
jgi:hypothetical protein